MVIGLSWSSRQWCRGSLISRPERFTQKEAFRIGSPAENMDGLACESRTVN